MAGFLAEDPANFIDAAAAMIGALADHGVEGIGETEDAAFQRDFFAGEMIGVALAVPAFVMPADDIGDGTGHFVFGEPLLALSGVVLNEGVFLGGEGAGAIEEPGGHVEFADVVECGGGGEDAEAAGWEAEAGADAAGDFGGAPLMVEGGTVEEAEVASGGADRLGDVGVFEEGIPATERGSQSAGGAFAKLAIADALRQERLEGGAGEGGPEGLSSLSSHGTLLGQASWYAICVPTARASCKFTQMG